MNRNLDVRNYAKKKSVYLYEVAEVLNISEPTIMRWLRADLSDERKSELFKAIDTVAAQHTAESTAAAAQ